MEPQQERPEIVPVAAAAWRLAVIPLVLRLRLVKTRHLDVHRHWSFSTLAFRQQIDHRVLVHLQVQQVVRHYLRENDCQRAAPSQVSQAVYPCLIRQISGHHQRSHRRHSAHCDHLKSAMIIDSAKQYLLLPS